MIVGAMMRASAASNAVSCPCSVSSLPRISVMFVLPASDLSAQIPPAEGSRTH
jgi:hypothetical protein